MPTNQLQVVAYAVLFFLLSDAAYYLLLLPVTFLLIFIGRFSKCLLFALKEFIIVAFCLYFTDYLDTTENSKNIVIVLLMIAALINGFLEASIERENEFRNDFGHAISGIMQGIVVVSVIIMYILYDLDILFLVGAVKWFPVVMEWMSRTPVFNVILWLYTYIGFFALLIYNGIMALRRRAMFKQW